MTSTPVTVSPPKVVLEVRETQDPEAGELSREMRSTKKHRLLLMLTNQMFDAVRRKACRSSPGDAETRTTLSSPR